MEHIIYYRTIVAHNQSDELLQQNYIKQENTLTNPQRT